MPKPKLPHKRHPLKAIKREMFTPAAERPEQTAVQNPGYFPGAHFSPAEVQYLRAIDAYRRRHRSKFLSAVDHMRVLLSLGYRLPTANGG